MEQMDGGKGVLADKFNRLVKILNDAGSALVAFSGGVDSTFLLYAARSVLGDRVAAYTAESPFVPKKAVEGAEAMARHLGVPHVRSRLDLLSREDLARNPADRCYLCKRLVYGEALRVARERGFAVLMDGTNASDAEAYRPGARALEELKVRAPLKQAGLTQSEIRILSRDAGLKTWDQPSESCLATRFPYGTLLTSQDLERVERAEDLLRELGFTGVRARVYEQMVRVEVPESLLVDAVRPSVRLLLVDRLKSLGFRYVTLDLEGYRSGSMDAADRFL